MVFSSVIFLFLFFPVVVVLYLPVRKRVVVRNAVLLAASLLFYFWGEGAYTLVMLLYIAVNYGCALCIESCKKAEGSGDARARRVVIFAVAFNLSLLFIFKAGSADTVHHREKADSINRIIAAEKPDIVIHERAERNLRALSQFKAPPEPAQRSKAAAR